MSQPIPWEIEPADLQAELSGPDAPLLVDCRTPGEREVASIEPSEFAPMQSLPEHLDDLRAKADRPMVVYCHGGVRSLRVTEALRNAGIENVRSLAGGIDRWSVEVDPDVPRY